MNTQDKIESVNYLKNFVVQSQKYELAAWLRDIEKSLLNELGKPYYTKIVNHGIIRYPQYHYLLELLDEFAKRKNHYPEETESIRQNLRKEFLDIIRQEKLDELFGDSDLS